MWTVKYLKKAEEDLAKLDHSQRIQVAKAIRKVSQNPLPQTEGGYGKPLGNHSRTKLSGFFKVKLSNLGIRIVYTLERREDTMVIVVISVREDGECYTEAEKRKP